MRTILHMWLRKMVLLWSLNKELLSSHDFSVTIFQLPEVAGCLIDSVRRKTQETEIEGNKE